VRRTSELSEFDMGLVCAASLMFQQGEDTLAFQVLNQGATIRVATVDELDKPMVRKWLKEKKRRTA
jgi:uncharacterized protein YggL (DUF469 family)